MDPVMQAEPAQHLDPRPFVEAAQRFAPGVQNPEPVGSAAHLMRFNTASGAIAVRQWPVGKQAEQVATVARALAAARDVDGIPQPIAASDDPDEWSVVVDGRRYSATTWLDGRPLARYGDYRTPEGAVIDVPLPASAPAEDIILEAAGVLGGFHTATRGLAAELGGGERSLTRLLSRQRSTWSEQRRTIGQVAADNQEIRRWLRCGNRVLPVAEELLVQVGTAASVAIIHGDLWPANVLVDGAGDERALSGIVGWSSATAGSPLIDIAQLVTHTSGWSGARAESVLGAYTETAELKPVERRLVPVVAALDLVPRVGALLNLAYLDDRMIGDASQPVLRSGLKALLHSLENLTEILAPDAEWTQRKSGETRHQRATNPTRRTRPTGTTPARQSGSGRSRPGSGRGKPKRG
jgi:Ser/Thr protein kinase RdoA (MazF antagonist)